MPETGKRLITLLAALALALLSACSGGGEAKTDRNSSLIKSQLKSADRLIRDGQIQAAIQDLEELSQEFPTNPDILEALAFAYAEVPDANLAAFYFERVFELDSKRTELLPYAARAYSDRGNHEQAVDAYQRFLEHVPDNGQAWKDLSKNYVALDKPSQAAEAYEQALGVEGREPDGGEAVLLANLYLGLDNTEKARRYLQAARRSEHPEHQRAALAGLFDVAMSEDRIEDADAIARELENTRFRGTLEKTRHYKRWKQEKMRQRREEQQRIAEEKAEQERQEKEARRLERERRRQEEAERQARIKREEEERVAADEARKREALEQRKPTLLSSHEELLQAAETFIAEEQYEDAIRFIWEVLKASPERSDAWHRLAQAYILNNQWLQAETTILEATRLEPSNVRYRLTYLKIVQKSQSPEKLMVELKRAYEDLPESPDIILLLARGYEQIEGNRRNAQFHYTEFLQRAPDHPKRAEVEEALRGL